MAVDVISGGFPCQDISYAGLGAGITGERSGLWRSMAKAICLVRPKFAVVENVAALLDRGMGTVCGDLAVSGYDCEWDCLPAYAFGAEHERQRIFIVAYPYEARSQIWGEAGADGENAGIFGKGLGFAIGTENAGLERRGAARWCGDVHGIPRRMDRIKSLGNAVVPQIAQWIAERILSSSEGNQ